jgi:3-hydroxybutyryl-CoA dehydratase
MPVPSVSGEDAPGQEKAMMECAYFEDFRVGDRVVSPDRTITETDIMVFAALTGDWHAVHTDAEYAKHTMFGERIAHGLLILAIGAGLLFQAGERGVPRSTIALYGVERTRFVAPTKIGDTIHVEAEVVQIGAIDERRGLIAFAHRILNQRGEEVLTYTSKLVVGRRPSAPQA